MEYYKTSYHQYTANTNIFPKLQGHTRKSKALAKTQEDLANFANNWVLQSQKLQANNITKGKQPRFALRTQLVESQYINFLQAVGA